VGVGESVSGGVEADSEVGRGGAASSGAGRRMGDVRGVGYGWDMKMAGWV
jgi:hypothetical protein